MDERFEATAFRRTAALFAVALATLAPCVARAADPRMVLAQARAAAGGAAWDAVGSLRVHYLAQAGDSAGTVDVLQDVRAGRFVTRTAFAAANGADGFDGVSVWTQGRSGESYVLGDEDARLGAVDDSFRTERGWWFPDRRPASVEDAGPQHEAGRTFDTVRITPEGGRPFTLWIDRATHLIDRDVEQAAEDVSTTSFSDYRRVAGVMLPYTVHRGDDVERVADVAVNVPFAETAFSVPASVAGSLAAKARAVTVPFRLDAGKIVFPVMLDGKGPFECIFDSGGSFHVPVSVVKTLALDTAGTTRQYGGGEGFAIAARGVVRSLSVGSADLGQQAFVTRPSSTPERLIAGLEILQRYVVRLDFDAMTMTLTPPEQFRYDGRGTVIPFHFQDNQPEVLGAVDGIAGTFAVDTGDSGSLLLIAPFARRYDFAKRYNAHIPYAGISTTATHGLYARGGTVVLDGADGRPVLSVSRPVTRISEQQSGFDANRYVSGNLGIGILDQFNITFDYSRRQLIFEPNHRYGEPDVFDRTGLRFARAADRWTVTDVYPDTPAAAAGLHAGDAISRIDTKGVGELDAAQTTALTHGAVGSTIDLEVESGGASRHVRLVLRDYL